MRSSRAATRGHRRRSRSASSRSWRSCPACRSRSCAGRPAAGRCCTARAFEWSFAVAFPPGVPTEGPRAAVDVGGPYGIVAAAFGAAFMELGVTLDGSGETPYQRSALCFAGALRYDICSRGEKLVAIAQAKKEGRALVHGSVLMQRPPEELVVAVEALVGEPWQGEGLAGAGAMLAPETIWNVDAAASRGCACAGRPPDEEDTRMTKILVLGGGPAGYVAAGRAAQLGAEVTRGRGARDRRHLPQPRLHPDQGDGRRRRAPARGAALGRVRRRVGEVGLDFAAFMARKDAATTQLRDGVAHLLKARKVRGGGRAGYARRPRPPDPRARRDAAGRHACSRRAASSRATPSSSPVARSPCAWACSTGATPG